MLKQHKTFDLDRERVSNQPKHEKVYEPKKCRYSMYFVVPAMIAFILLCILVNVDFTGEAYSKNNYKKEDYNLNKGENSNQINIKLELNYEKKITQTPYDFLETNGEFEDFKQQTDLKSQTEPNESTILIQTSLMELTESSREYVEHFEPTELIASTEPHSNSLNSNSRAVAPAKCSPTTSNCTLYCSNGSLGYLDDNLESLQKICPGEDLSLILQNCEFYKGILSRAIFGGFFTLKYLAIWDSNVQTIQTDAFEERNVVNLQTLILRNNLVQTLTATTFKGATSLKYFEFVQQAMPSTFSAEQFLKPMAGNLTEAVISQLMENDIVLNPRTWLQGTELTALVDLNMANNNFQDILDVTTFRTLIAIENLNLANCNLQTIQEKTFDVILNSLKYLDLSNNHLKVLDLELLQHVVTRQIQLQLTANEWYCDCENKELIEFLRKNSQLIEKILCNAPDKWENVEIIEFIKECGNFITTLSSTTEDATTLNTTKIKDDTTISIPTTDSSIGNGDNTTISTTEISTTTSVTTTTPSDRSSTLPSNSIYVKCLEANNTETIFWFQKNEDFFIYSTSLSSVNIQISKSLKSFNIIYFTNYKNNRTENFHSISHNFVSIKGLTSYATYIFCLVTENHTRISPFDCRAHFVGYFKVSWLLAEDKTWFITVIIICCIIFIAAAVIAVYATLRKHPIRLLKRNEIVLKETKEPNDRSSRYLTAQQATQYRSGDSDEISLYSSKHAVPAVRAPTIPTQQDNRKSSCPSYDTAQKSVLGSEYLSVHFNRFRNTRDDQTSLYTSQHTVPDEKAPYLPTQRKCATTPLYTTCPQSSIVHFNRFQQLDNDDPDYQTIDHYEVVNF